MTKEFWKSAWWRGGLIVLLTVVAYWPALKCDFIWDDNRLLTENPCVVGPLGLKEIWTTSAARICPLVLTSFWAQHAIWGLNPLPYHLVNILMHAACGVALWLVLRSLNVRGAWLGAALWALHPVQVESVAWITELKSTQSGLFFLLSILLFVKWTQTKVFLGREGGEKFYFLALICAALAMTSKSSTVILPLVLGLCAWWVDGRWNWRVAPRLVPFFFFSLVMSGVSMWTQRLEGAVGDEWARSGPERIVTAGNVVWFYLGKLLWPHPLIFIYPRWGIDASRVVSYLPSLAVVVVVIVLLKFWNKPEGRAIAMAFAYFLMTLLPVLGLVNHYFLRYSFVGDHFQYLASMGPMALAGAAIWTAFDFWKMPGRAPRLILCGMLLALLCVLTWRQTGIYRNSETLWRDTLAKNPDCSIGHNNLGCILARQGDPLEAEVHFREALKTDSRNLETLRNLATSLASRKQYPEAIRYYEAALRLNPNYAMARFQLGVALAAQGDKSAAVSNWWEVVRSNPDLPMPLNYLAWTLATDKDPAIRNGSEAIRLAQQLVRSHESAETLATLAAACAEAGRFAHRSKGGRYDHRLHKSTIHHRHSRPSRGIPVWQTLAGMKKTPRLIPLSRRDSPSE